MKYSKHNLQTDVMARLGELARPQDALPGQSVLTDVPWPEDIIGMRVASLLGETGSELIKEASGELLDAASLIPVAEVAMRLMPCGLYAAEARIPEGFLRMTSVKMTGWRRSVQNLTLPASTAWSRQWSAEPGIAGCPDSPRAYLDHDGEGLLLRLMASENAEDTLGWLSGWCVPVPDEEGGFHFPVSLYVELVGAIAEKLR